MTQEYTDGSVSRIRSVLENYLKATGEDSNVLLESPEQPVGDLIADLLHFCDEWHVDFDVCMDRARSYFNEER